ncbi:response regulator transcription factor [Sulfurospirillum sp. 1307]|jgi:DNA-binding response OmpR family regulator
METILIVEDEEDILDLLEYTLSSDGYECICCVDTLHVKNILDEENVDLILMDRNLPSQEGSVFINSIRKEGYNIPVIYLSAKDSPQNILEGFDRGGDDYITKPFNTLELKARVRALLKRVQKDDEVIKFRDITYHSLNKTFFIDGEEKSLTTLEKKLLLEFMKNPNIILSRGTLLEKVWPDSFDKQSKTVNVAIKRLKEKIDPSGEKNYIKTARGEGYKLC